jgi:hypothetical protein
MFSIGGRLIRSSAAPPKIGGRDGRGGGATGDARGGAETGA